jgi:hypothetical protein
MHCVVVQERARLLEISYQVCNIVLAVKFRWTDCMCVVIVLSVLTTEMVTLTSL